MKIRRGWLKILRDVRRARWQFLAAGVVIGLGVAIFIGAYASYQNLRTSYDKTYEELKMGDLWFQFADAPATAVDAIRSEPGVQAAEGRLVEELPVVPPEMAPQQSLVRFISLPDPQTGIRPSVNDIKLTSGSLPSAPNDIILERSFADFNEIRPGENLELLVPDGNTLGLRVAGIAASPEYLWVARSEQELFVVPSDFGVGWIAYDDLAAIAGKQGRINDVAIRLATGAPGQDVARRVSGILSQYGPVRVIDREHQVSNRLLRLDLDGFRSLALVFPILFLTVSSFAVYTLLNRLVQSQRGQIGVMRAMGFSRGQVLRHYAGYGILIGLGGGTFGLALGTALSIFLTQAYANVLHVPFVAIRTHPQVLAIAFAAGFLAACVAAALPAWTSAGIRPAVAMRPPSPPAGRRMFLEKLIRPLARAPLVFKLPLRSVVRDRRRTLYTGFGVAAGIALTLVGASFLDSYNATIHMQFDQIQNYDARLNFTTPGSADLATTVAEVDGVRAVEPIAEASVELSANGRTHFTVLRGIPADGELLRTYAPGGERIRPGDGLLLSGPVADSLGVRPGDEVTLQPLSGDAGTRLTVDAIVQQPLGDTAFARIKAAQSLLGRPDAATSLLLDLRGSEPSPALEASLLDLPGAANLELTSELRHYVNELSQLFLVFTGVMLAFGVALGFTIIFNTVTINVLERQRELATMRTFGTGISRVSVMLTTENILTALIGVLFGVPAGYGLALYFSSLYNNEILDMPMVIDWSTYAIAGVAALLVVVLAEVPSIRHVRRLDLPSVVREMST